MAEVRCGEVEILRAPGWWRNTEFKPNAGFPRPRGGQARSKPQPARSLAFQQMNW